MKEKEEEAIDRGRGWPPIWRFFFSLFDEIGLNYGPGSVVFFLLHNSSYRVEFQMTVSGRGSIEIHGVAPFIDVRFDGEKSARKGFQMLS